MNRRHPATMASRKIQRGVTLVELMIVVIIVGILAAIAYPSYIKYVTKSNRSAAESFLLTVANKQEQYMLDARNYVNDPGALSTLNLTTPSEVSSHYTISVSADNSTTPPSYTITATPTGSQLTRDTDCANLTLNQAGAKGISGTSSVTNCW
jgi:type IV pilus assembly protein PilE